MKKIEVNQLCRKEGSSGKDYRTIPKNYLAIPEFVVRRLKIQVGEIFNIELKEEVIKLIKLFRDPPLDFGGVAIEDIKSGESGTVVMGIDMRWTMFLFDITEEDLE